jgi:Mg-chelatase subunit ChlD
MKQVFLIIAIIISSNAIAQKSNDFVFLFDNSGSMAVIIRINKACSISSARL